MTVRVATLGDVPAIGEMIERFIEAAGTPPSTPADRDEFVSQLIQSDMGEVFVTQRGFIACLAAPLHYNRSYIQAHELAWWSEDGQGRHLLRAFEDWAARVGANEIIMSTLSKSTSPVAGKLLARRGYEPRDVAHVKGL